MLAKSARNMLSLSLIQEFMRMKTLFFSLSFLLSFGLQGIAQQKKFSPAEEELKKYVFSFGEDYGAFGKNKDKIKVLNYMDKEVLGTLITTDLSDKITAFDSDLAGFDNHLKGILLKDGLQINYKIKNITRAYVNGDVGIAIYEATYEQEKNKEIWSSGEETVALTLKKDPLKQWKIIHYTTIAFENAKYKGQCFCGVKEIETSQGTPVQYQTTTTAPAGKGYSGFAHDFKFTTKDQDKIIEVTQKMERESIVKVGKKTEKKVETISEDYTFYMTFGGELYLLKGKKPISGELIDEKEPKKENGVGVTPNKEEAMMQIIQKYLMPTTCTSMKYQQ